MSDVDYKELLRKYIDHVEYEEGVNYISRTSEPWFTPQEMEALRELAKHDDDA